MNEKEFNLQERDYNGKNNPHWKGINVKEMTSHEKYLRYKETIKKNNKKNYKKYKFGKYIKKYAYKNIDKIKAKDKAVKIKMPENKLCEICEEKFATQKHHNDYSKPLEVQFLCRSCHGEADRLRRLKENGE